MKQNRQFVRVNSDFINKNLSAGAVKVLFLLASIARAGGSDTAVISNTRIAERSITRSEEHTSDSSHL